jgi:hypothetical protein
MMVMRGKESGIEDDEDGEEDEHEKEEDNDVWIENKGLNWV